MHFLRGVMLTDAKTSNARVTSGKQFFVPFGYCSCKLGAQVFPEICPISSSEWAMGPSSWKVWTQVYAEAEPSIVYDLICTCMSVKYIQRCFIISNSQELR